MHRTAEKQKSELPFPKTPSQPPRKKDRNEKMKTKKETDGSEKVWNPLVGFGNAILTGLQNKYRKQTAV